MNKFIACVLSLCISLSIYSQNLKFAILTDTHIGKPDAKSKMVDAIESINARKDIQFVLHLGDITDHGTEEELVLAKNILLKLNKPLYITTGNHDARWPERREAFIKVFKKSRFCFVKDGIRFIGCCTGPYETIKRATVNHNDLEWIKKKCRKPLPTVVALHYTYDSIYNRNDLVNALGNSEIILWLAGHMRFNTIKSEEPYPCLIDISQLENAKYNIVTINENRLSIDVVSPREDTMEHWYDHKLNN